MVSVRIARAHNRARSLAGTSSCTCIMDRKLPLTKINQCNKRLSYASINYDFSFLLILSIFWLYVHVLHDMDMLPVFSLKNCQASNLARGPQSSSPQPANSSPHVTFKRSPISRMVSILGFLTILFRVCNCVCNEFSVTNL